MRRSYRDTLNRVLKKKGLLRKLLAAHIRPGLIEPPASPVLATLQVTRRCNLSCTICESRHEGNGEQDIAWMKEAVKELARAGVLGLGFTGGEPLLVKDFDSLARAAAGAGLITHLNTNGTLVTRERAQRLLDTGLHSINVSLDGADALVHDRVRGKGSFEKARKGAAHLIGEKRRTRIQLVMTLGEHNAHQAGNLVNLARTLGADGCSFLPLMHQARPEQRPLSEAAAAAASALAAGAGDPLIDNSVRYLKAMARYFKGTLMPTRCSALHTSLLVSPDRKLYPCVPSAVRTDRGIEARPGALMQTFRSGALAACIDERLCQGCWWNCHRELDLALGVL